MNYRLDHVGVLIYASQTIRSPDVIRISCPADDIKNLSKEKMGRFLDLIYGEIHSIAARKTREHVHCDYKCRQAGHRYIHKFESTAKLQGIPDGSFLMLADGRSFKLSDGSMLISDKEY